ncbi:TPA: hypothetical protein UMT99_000713 [Stenotrophomonas maltophilia]|nr:hypothetical protein [Stenotrophomonas maltophilia]
MEIDWDRMGTLKHASGGYDIRTDPLRILVTTAEQVHEGEVSDMLIVMDDGTVIPAVAGSLVGTVPLCRGDLNRVPTLDQRIQIHRRCRQCILCILCVEIPPVPVVPCQQVADRLCALVGLVFSLGLLQLIAMDLAQHELVRVLGALALPVDVGQARKCGSKRECGHWHGGCPAAVGA